jgi:hypothetical protein
MHRRKRSGELVDPRGTSAVARPVGKKTKVWCFIFVFGFAVSCYAPVYGANNAEFISQSVPARMVSGCTYPVSITMKNTSDAAWTQAGGYKLGSVNPHDNQYWSRTRVALQSADSIAPGGTKKFEFTVVAPSTAGTYSFQWQMLQEGVEWFGPNTADAPVVTLINVTSDRSNYLTGESPVYTVTGADPGTPILWSRWKNGTPVETNADHGQVTDGNGGWSGAGAAWTPADAGFWTTQVRIGSSTGTVNSTVNPTLSSQPPTTAKDALGVTHVAGDYRLTDEPFLLEGAKFIENMGSENIFVYLSFSYDIYYPATDFGLPAPATLTALAQTTPYRQLFEMPFKTFVITAFPFADMGWTPDVSSFTVTRSANVTGEMYQLTKYLMQTYQGSGKTFIFKNWEGDWWMNHSPYPNCIPKEENIQRMTDWLNARHQGIVQARQELSSVTGVTVLDAAEFVALDNARQDLPCMLNTVVPNVQCDYIAYSSWRTIGSPATSELRRKILDDIAFIRGYPNVGARPLMITEYGFREKKFTDPGERTDIAARAFLEAGIAKAFYWEIIDNECEHNQPDPPGASSGLELLRQDGTRTPAWAALRNLLAPQNNAAFVSQEVPAYMAPGLTYPVRVAMKNTGTLPWNKANKYRLGSQYPQDNQVWGAGRIELDAEESIRPGETKVFQFTITASSPGASAFQWRMLQEGLAWFGDATPCAEIVQSTGEIVNAGATTLTAGHDVTITNTVLPDGTTQQCIISTAAATVLYGNGISIALPPACEAKAIASADGLTVTSTGAITVSYAGFMVEPTSGTMSLAASAGEIGAALSSGAVQNMRITVPPGFSRAVSARLDLPYGEAQVHIMPETFAENAVLRIKMPSVLPSVTVADMRTRLKGIGAGLEIETEKTLLLQKQISLEMAYRDADVVGTDPDTLMLCRFSETARRWTYLPSTVSRSPGKVSGVTDHLSVFRLMAVLPGNDVDRVIAFPNPLQPSLGHAAMTFSNAVAHAEIRIYDLAGELLRELQSDIKGQAEWDGTNSCGKKVASGVYFAVVERNGRRKTLKIAVIR